METELFTPAHCSSHARTAFVAQQPLSTHGHNDFQWCLKGAAC
jgi:hypothetical protein